MKGAVIFLDPKGTILEIIRIAKQRGYQVIALSSDASLLNAAPDPYKSALSCIERVIHVKNWTNERAILNICDSIHSEMPIVGVYAGMDSCAKILAQLRDKYGLPTSRAEDLEIILNKYSLRKKLNALGLSKIKNYHSDEVSKWSAWVPKGAVYFKPVHGFFSAYVRRCENMIELQDAIATLKAGNKDEPEYITNYLRKTNDFLLEDAFDGELLSVEAIACNGNVQVLGLLSRILYSKDPVVEMGSCFPYPHSLSDKIISLVKNAHEALGLTDGPTHTEVIVNRNGEVEIIDLNPRFVGADVLQSINYAFGIKIQEALFDYTIGAEVKINKKEEHYSCIQYFLPPLIETLKNVLFPDVPEIKFSAAFMAPGAKVANTKRQIDYLGCYLTVMPTFQSAVDRSKELRSMVKINDNYIGEY